jgi:hypothetical protein
MCLLVTFQASLLAQAVTGAGTRRYSRDNWVHHLRNAITIFQDDKGPRTPAKRANLMIAVMSPLHQQAKGGVHEDLRVRTQQSHFSGELVDLYTCKQVQCVCVRVTLVKRRYCSLHTLSLTSGLTAGCACYDNKRTAAPSNMHACSTQGTGFGLACAAADACAGFTGVCTVSIVAPPSI